MKRFLILTFLVFSFYSQANDVCEMIFKVRYPGKLNKVATKTAQSNYSKLAKSVKSLEAKNTKIAFGSTKVSATKYLQNLKKHYTGKSVPSSFKPKDHFDEIEEVYNSIKKMPESEVVKKLQESMQRYAKGYKATMGVDLKIPGVDAAYDGQTLNSLFESVIKGGDLNSFNKYIDNFLVTDPNTNKLDILRAELMSWYGQEMDLFYEPLINQVKRKASSVASDGVSVTKKQIKDWKQRADYIEEVKEAKFKISRAINRFESFQVDQVKRVGMEDFVMTRNNNLENLTYLELSDYETYTRSLVYDLTEARPANYARGFLGQKEMKRINGEKFKLPLKDKNHKDIKKMYDELDEGNLGILSISEYRDIVSKNAFPMFIKRHDMRHVHYALSHPRALGTVMGATRSQNHLRFSQLGGMYEAIETVQYGFEQSIAQYFSRKIDQNSFMIMKRNLDLEESMLTLATTPRVFSYGIGEAHGFGSHWRNSVDELQGWVPKSVVNSSNDVILDGSLRMKRGVVDGKEKYIKMAKIKNPDGTIQEVPVYLDSSGKYTSRTEIDPNMTSLNEDIDLMVKNQQEQLEKYNSVRENVIKRANQENKYWYEVMTEEEEILFHMYNYQKDPDKAAVSVFIKNESGEAVSDISYINEQMINPNGAKWKNDGRAHYEGDGTTGEFGFGSGTNVPE